MALGFEKRSGRAVIVAVSGVVSVCLLGGCHSAYVAADIKNESGGAISLAELDYPSASFGTESLAAGAKYHYRFKILGSGPTKVLWTDAAHHDHSVSGPELKEGQEGVLTVTITGTTAHWTTSLRP
jgi:hypothetical protein